jgi:hypothetical protein
LDKESLKIIEAYEKEFREKGLKPEAFHPCMFDLTQINFEDKEDPISLFAYLRLMIESFDENIYDSLTYTLKDKGLSAIVKIDHDF